MQCKLKIPLNYDYIKLNKLYAKPIREFLKGIPKEQIDEAIRFIKDHAKEYPCYLVLREDGMHILTESEFNNIYDMLLEN